MLDPRIRVLLVEDDEDDYVLTREMLSDIPGEPFQLDWVSSYDAALDALGRHAYDVCLVDYRLGQRSGLDLLEMVMRNGCRAPVIMLTAQGERAVDLEAMRAGAADFLVKGQIDAATLERAIRYAIERKRDRDALRQIHQELERRVQERTAALEQANQALQAEIAERKRVEAALRESGEQLRQRAAELAEADRRKNEFLAMLSHELRNPLAPIVNSLYLLRQDRTDDPVFQQSRGMIERQVQHLARLVDDLLDVSRISQGKIQLRKEPVELQAIIERAAEAVRPLMDARRHQFVVSLPPERLWLEADPTRLEQVLSNLLNNAAKYSEPKGRIGLTVQRKDAQVTICVRDTGVGIPPEMLSHIFEPFTQVPRSLDRSQGGLGIGLTLVKCLVEMHGGSVGAASAGPGQGCEFTVRLPLLREVRGSRRSAAESAPPARPLQVLVVDDNVDAAASLGVLLRLFGHAVQIVHHAAAALEAAGAGPDVVLLDIGLPEMDGFEVARRLRQQAGDRTPVLIAVTGYGQEGDRRRAREAGFDHHLVKPVDPTTLQELLRRLGDEMVAR